MTAKILLIDTKFAHNLGGVVRAAGCFGVPTVRWTGDRVEWDIGTKGFRLPREERLRDYSGIDWRHTDSRRPLDDIEFYDMTPVAVEFLSSAEDLTYFEHPKDAVYVFGPEDGSIPSGVMRACHRFVKIPTRHCLNLGAAVNVVLYDRMMKERTGVSLR